MEEEQNHDHDHHEKGTSGVGGSRWNPTKEQIALLEKMYSEGVRTPSAEQIQQITVRLKAYGHIEGKNVFYWFQNHKARQRQKQRQHRFSPHLINHPSFLSPQQHPPNNTNQNRNINLNLNPKPIFPAPPSANFHPNHHHHRYLHIPTVTGPYYYQQMQHTNLGFYSVPPPQYHNSVFVGDMNNTTGYDDHQQGVVKTLDLFPEHPTGVLKHKVESISTNSSSSSIDTLMSEQQQRVLDFFSGDHTSSESD